MLAEAAVLAKTMSANKSFTEFDAVSPAFCCGPTVQTAALSHSSTTRSYSPMFGGWSSVSRCRGLWAAARSSTSTRSLRQVCLIGWQIPPARCTSCAVGLGPGISQHWPFVYIPKKVQSSETTPSTTPGTTSAGSKATAARSSITDSVSVRTVICLDLPWLLLALPFSLRLRLLATTTAVLMRSASLASTAGANLEISPLLQFFEGNLPVVRDVVVSGNTFTGEGNHPIHCSTMCGRDAPGSGPQ